MPSCQDLSSSFSLLLSRIAQLMELLHDVIKVDDKVKNSMFSDASGQAGKLYDISHPFPITGSSLYQSFLDFHSHNFPGVGFDLVMAVLETWLSFPLRPVVHSRDVSKLPTLIGIVRCELFSIEVDEKVKNSVFSGAGGQADKLNEAHPTVEANNDEDCLVRSACF